MIPNYIWSFFLFCFFSLGTQAQVGSQHVVKKKFGQEWTRLDTLSIYSQSFVVLKGTDTLPSSAYEINYLTSAFRLTQAYSDSLTIAYQVWPLDFSKQYYRRDSSYIFKERPTSERDLFKLETNAPPDPHFFGGNELAKNGSISRGLSFGNKQNLGINSALNLELNGMIGDNLKLSASISDANIPIQPDGNTNKLQEFDQVYIQVSTDQFKLITGDFWLSKPTGYFMNYKKRGQGMSAEFQGKTLTGNTWITQNSVALSKGKFNRQIIQGVEANQGPYRLRGAENEPFITILSGTERIYIDGKLLTRGQEFDYTIDYNTSELVFTSRYLITKDTRIVAEFQYADQNYARSLLQSATHYETKKGAFWFNAYSEQDAKNQSLQQDLSSAQKFALAQIGDQLSLAVINSIDSVGYIENQILYQLVDSLGYDSILVFSVDPNLAHFRASFQYVGEHKGNYVFDSYNALGKVYKWVAPQAGVPQGDYSPNRNIITPKQKQMLSSGMNYQVNHLLRIETECAYTTNDKNTFSRLDSNDDQGFSNRSKLVQVIPLKKEEWKSVSLESYVEFEYLSTSFSPIEQYRKVEFDRDWNTRNKNYLGAQRSIYGGLKLSDKQNKSAKIEAQNYSIGTAFSGSRIFSDGNWKQKGWSAVWDASALNSKSNASNAGNTFVRHRLDISKKIGALKIGFKDDHERNVFQVDSLLTAPSYQFFDYQWYVSNADSTNYQYKLYYRERLDQRSDSSQLVNAAKARTAGAEWNWNKWKNQRLTILSAYRSLRIINPILLPQSPENSLVGRFEYEGRFLKNALTVNTFYEVGSGLEQKKQFQYLKVNDGQGVYTWIDYNNDGVKDLNEFEIAQYVDQASYIRVFIPSNEYASTYSNEYNQSVFWRPERIWSNESLWKSIFVKFSDQARMRTQRKVNEFDLQNAFNPFYSDVSNFHLLSSSMNMSNILFFNRMGKVFTAEYQIQQNNTKNLLANGQDAKSQKSQELVIRWNIHPTFTMETSLKQGAKSSLVDYTLGRNYQYTYAQVQQSLIYQGSTNARYALSGRISNKQNDGIYGGEHCLLRELGVTWKQNQTEKGSFQGEFKWIQLAYTGSAQSAIGYEMLESLKPGSNFTWTVSYQRTLSKNLQLTLQYSGRDMGNTRTIHNGSMELRAFF
ncbi:MAG: hypothetical protein ACKOXP_03335 [Flavobacteriales bacterium]